MASPAPAPFGSTPRSVARAAGRKPAEGIALIDVPGDRVLVEHGLKHYRRRYSLAEVRWGLACGAVLAAILGWVAWRGAHPDPSLFAADEALLDTGKVAAKVASVSQRPRTPPGGGNAVGAMRGALPADLAGLGWREEKLGSFQPDNLYVKINGRADFFLSFGFQRLFAVSLVDQDGERSIDVEMYDLGRGANALGAYAGERSEGVVTNVRPDGVSHLDRNALYLTRGRYYVRLIGSDETEGVSAKLAELRERFERSVPGEPMPWGHALFMGQGLDPGKVSYLRESAFSFGFASDVYAAALGDGGDDATEIFIVAKTSEGEARKLATAFNKGFREYGEKAAKLAGVAGVEWTKDRYIGSLATAIARGRFVIGVRGAPDATRAAAAFARIAEAERAMPQELRSRAQPAQEGGDDGEH